MREKLIELVGQVQDCGCDVTDVVEMNYVENDVLVDHLIANSVTVTDNNVAYKLKATEPLTDCQRWIPVTERLPKMRGDGFADAFLVTDGYLGHIAYFVDGEWIFTDNGEMKEHMFYAVTHWMPLPTPPKGE